LPNIHGRLRWADLQRSSDLPPAGVPPDAAVEWAVPIH